VKVLIIEDEAELRRSIKEYLYQEGYLVESASDFIQASEKAGLYDYDCIVVDITLPSGSGLDIVKQLKSKGSKTGIIIISAKNSLDDKITGLDYGADDYLTKPFHLSELNARIKAVIRRKNFDGSTVIKVNEITIEPDKRKVCIHNKEITLTSKEYDLLMYLVSNKNRVVSKSAIAEHLWGDNADQADGHDFIYTHIKNLRKKMMEKGGEDYLQTVYGIGYNFKTG
jgi:DNA-binding response OmpR family regulator